MLDENIPADAREELDKSLREIRERLTNGTLPQAEVLPLLQEMQKVAGDRKVTPDEFQALQKIVASILQEPRPDAPAGPVEL